MGKAKVRNRSKRPLFKVGDFVSFPFGWGEVTGKIVEDRGCLGVGGRRLYGIRFEMSEENVRYTEMPEEELTAATEDDRAEASRRLQ